MQTRSGSFYSGSENPCRKRKATSPPQADADNLLTGLHDELVISILCKLAATATSTSDVIGVSMTCKRLYKLGHDPFVLSNTSIKALAIRPNNWTDQSHRFLKRCAIAGNLEASYILGMINFYCLGNHRGGFSMMAKAAIKSHPSALYSLAIIKFNGSGGKRNDKDLRAGVALLAQSASLKHTEAVRELGHCLQDGYGVRKNIAEGRRLLIQANTQELACALWGSRSDAFPMKVHPANRFLAGWFGSREVEPDLRLCSHKDCGRLETRKHEFRRCSVCGKANYCSRACQAMHWKFVHKSECMPAVVVPDNEALIDMLLEEAEL